MAVEFDGGVVIGADSRTSSGAYVANRVTDKLTQISENIYCCRSGSAADTQAIADIVAYSLNYHRNQTNKEPLVCEAASEFRNYCYNYRDSLLAGIIVAGWDEERGGQVYSVPLGGMLTREGCTIGGSGSSYIYGFVKEHYRPGMPMDECIDFVKKGLCCFFIFIYLTLIAPSASQLYNMPSTMMAAPAASCVSALSPRMAWSVDCSTTQ